MDFEIKIIKSLFVVFERTNCYGSVQGSVVKVGVDSTTFCAMAYTTGASR